MVNCLATPRLGRAMAIVFSRAIVFRGWNRLKGLLSNAIEELLVK